LRVRAPARLGLPRARRRRHAGFLRPNAELAVIFLTNEDDCSAPADTTLYSLEVGGSNQQNLSNALGPVANYRCNSFGHLCVDPASNTSCLIEPPLHVPADAQMSAAGLSLNLTDCESADGPGMLSSVSSFVTGIRALKADPDHQIVVGAIVAPAAPYTVNWQPEVGGQNTQPGELWPEVEHSCGAAGDPYLNPLATATTTDGSFGDPAVRVTQYVKAFGGNGIVGSVCDLSYANTVTTIVNKIAAYLPGGVVPTSTGGSGGGTSALPICSNGLNPGADAGTSTGTGGVSGGCGTGGAPPASGLHNGGGCDVTGSRPGVWTLSALVVLLAPAWRRRALLR
jgi:hypothetical protein